MAAEFFTDWNADIRDWIETARKIIVIGRCSYDRKLPSCQTLQICNDTSALRLITAAAKVDEVDGRSPVERAAAAFVPTCVSTFFGALETQHSLLRRGGVSRSYTAWREIFIGVIHILNALPPSSETW